MTQNADVYLFFNFRSPYCYLASKRMFRIFDEYRSNMLWRPLGGYGGRSPPDRARVKMPIARQDVARWARRMGIPLNPPPRDTDPTAAGAVSLLAEKRGLLRPYIVEMMRAEWAKGEDIGKPEVIVSVGTAIGLEKRELEQAVDDPGLRSRLDANWDEAQQKGVIGVPSFVIDDQVFWGQDRIDFVEEHLCELRLSRL